MPKTSKKTAAKKTTEKASLTPTAEKLKPLGVGVSKPLHGGK